MINDIIIQLNGPRLEKKAANKKPSPVLPFGYAAPVNRRQIRLRHPHGVIKSIPRATPELT
jgi:hypothetical protein